MKPSALAYTQLYFTQILGGEETRKIWKSNLRRLLKHKESNQQKLVVNEDEIISYALVHYDWHCAWKRPVWNGRQIRNSFQTAVCSSRVRCQRGEGRGKEADRSREQKRHNPQMGAFQSNRKGFSRFRELSPRHTRNVGVGHG